MFWNSKKSDIQCIERVLKLLLGYHACPIEDNAFQIKYGHLLRLYFLLCRQKKIEPSYKLYYEEE